MTVEDPTIDATSERALLGGLLLAPAGVHGLGSLAPEDFADSRHGAVYAAIRTVVERDGVAADHLLVIEELRRTGQLVRIGGGAALHSMIDACPSTANVGWYARKVRETAQMRHVRGLGLRLQQITEQPDLAVALDNAAALLLELQVTVDSPDTDRAPIGGLSTLESFVDESDDAHDWVIPGLLERQDRVIVVASEGSGKALALDTLIPGPDGMRKMADLQAGDRVFAEDGSPCSVVAATEVMHDRPCYRVVFSDGTEIVADANHQWTVQTYAQRQQTHKGAPTTTLTTAEIAASVRARNGHCLNHSIDVAGPLQFPHADLPVGPYTLGAWLGDGTTAAASLTCADPEIPEQIRSEGYDVEKSEAVTLRWSIRSTSDRAARIADGLSLVRRGASARWASLRVGLPPCSLNVPAREAGIPLDRDDTRRPPTDDSGIPEYKPWRSLQVALREIGVLGAKRIPELYLTASVPQRLALLQGLMDTDGTVCAAGDRCEITLCAPDLAADVHRLVVELGHKALLKESDARLNGRTVGRRWRISFQTELPVFRLPRKAERLKPARTQRGRRRFIQECVPVESVPVKCIEVDSPSKLYLATEACVPTHNSTLSRQVAVMVAAGLHPFAPGQRIPAMRTLMIDLENPPSLVRRKTRHLVERARNIGVWSDGKAFRWTKPGGLNLRRAADARLLDRVLAETQPALVCLGPLYKAFLAGSDSGEQAAGETAAVLDRMRERHGVALWLEHHAPLAQQGSRDLRPFGSALWSRWPEFGIALRADGQDPHALRVDSFRGHRDERSWPTQLRRGPSGDWPWTAFYGELDEDGPIDPYGVTR